MGEAPRGMESGQYEQEGDEPAGDVQTMEIGER